MAMKGLREGTQSMLAEDEDEDQDNEEFRQFVAATKSNKVSGEVLILVLFSGL
jgi:hypothetical protein